MLSVALNVPTTHNEALLAALRDAGADVQVRFRATAAATGRTWEPAAPVCGVLGELAVAARSIRGPDHPDVLLSGGWAHPVELLRRTLAPFGARSVHWWGERLAPTTAARRAARTTWLRAPGLDGILAVGSLARAGYREATGGRLPVHVLPYVTDRGLAIAPTPGDQPVLGVVARLLRYKGVDMAIRALRSLPEDVALDVVGAGPLDAELRALAAPLGSRVRFHGALPPTRLDARRQGWWAQVVPNRGPEGWGMAVNEALGSGVPVVATAHVAAAVDLVEPGSTGAVVPTDAAEDPDALAAALLPFLDPATQQAAGAAAKATGAAFGPQPAARWLLGLLRDQPGEERSFVEVARAQAAGGAAAAPGADR